MNKPNIKYMEDVIAIDSRAFNKDFDDIDYEPHSVSDADEQEGEKYGY